VPADLRARVARLNWEAIERSLDADGFARTGRVLSPSECGRLAGLYEQERRFRSRVVMERLGFGRGEYKYFAYPLPGPIGALLSSPINLILVTRLPKDWPVRPAIIQRL
jgi:hypothetical protein